MTDSITIRDWYRHLLVNGASSYSLAHCAAALLLAELGAEDESDWDAILASNMNGLTGFQASAAKSVARQVWPLFAPAREARQQREAALRAYLEGQE